jgi:hypothetical protein
VWETPAAVRLGQAEGRVYIAFVKPTECDVGDNEEQNRRHDPRCTVTPAASSRSAGGDSAFLPNFVVLISTGGDVDLAHFAS